MNSPAAESLLTMYTVLLFFLISSPFVRGQVPVSSFSIEDSKFSCAGSGGNLRCSGNATTTIDGLLKLTPDPLDRKENYTYYLNTFGVALYKDPVQIMNRSSNQAASLNISFSFQIEGSEDGPGDGLAFVMFSNESWVGAPGAAFGAFNEYGHAGVKTLAVEFDTHYNLDVDDDGNHVGIDIRSTTSEEAAKFPVPLSSGFRIYAWVEYVPENLLLEVRVNSIPERPVKPIISYNRNLMDVFDVENVWVGFSGANGFCTCFSFHTVYNLNFQSSFPSTAPAT